MDTKEYWAKRYRALSAYGYSDPEIADFAGVSRGLICNVRNGTYPHNHDLPFHGGQRIEKVYAHVLRKQAEAEG